jgi:predicted small lipoprotein YifL
LALVGVLTATAVVLAGCGRAGPLDPPPSALGPAPAPAAAVSPAPMASADPTAAHAASRDLAAKNGFDAQGNPVAAPGQKKDFPLDFLLQ